MPIIDTDLHARRAVSDIIFAYRHVQGPASRPLSYRDFATALTQVLKPMGASISHQAIRHWEHRKHLPRIFLMLQLALHTPDDWRREMAEDILGVMRPNIYQVASPIGQRALDRSLIETGPHKRRYDIIYLQS